MTEEVRPGGTCKTPADKREVSTPAEERFVPALAAFCGASFGFMMPVSTPQNAGAYGSGMIPITAGIVLAG